MKATSLLFSFFFSVIVYGQKTILWKISNTKTQKVSYLLGTNHLFGNSFIDSFPIINEKILVSNLVITETKMDRAAITALYNSRPASDSINLVLSKTDIDYITELFTKKNTIPITKFSPGELVLKLQAYLPKSKCSIFNGNDKLSMDEYVQSIGKKNGKQIYSFETDSFQIQMLTASFSKYNWDFAKRNVPVILDLYRDKKFNSLMCYAIDQYAALDIDYKFKDSCNLFKGNIMTSDAVIKNRNDAWIAQLPKILEDNNCFIAVGLAHLYNQCGLIKQLEALGYIVEPVTMK